jgi:NAD(P)-dependent dehydrogenase (short-subunit alcohol dehydrogenase family)
MTVTPRFAFVTGAGSGIGRAIVTRLAAEGWVVVLADVDGAAISATAQQLGGGAMAIATDVTQPASVGAAFAQLAGQTGGKLDLLVNCAGLLFTGDFEDEPLEHAQRMMAVNTLGPVLCCRAALPLLKASATQGRNPVVINISSASAIFGIPSMGLYSATKFFVRGLTEALASEWARHGIKVRTVVPPFVNTPMVQTNPNHLLMKRLGVDLAPDDVARQVLIAARRGPLHRAVSLKFKALILLSYVLPAPAMRFGLRVMAGYWPARKD